jgi:hypothetical protein
MRLIQLLAWTIRLKVYRYMLRASMCLAMLAKRVEP